MSPELAAVRAILADPLLPTPQEREVITSNLKRSLHGRRQGVATHAALKAKRNRWVAGDFASRSVAAFRERHRPAGSLTAEEIGPRLGITRKAAWKLIERRPDMPRVKVGQHVFFDVEILRRWKVLP